MVTDLIAHVGDVTKLNGQLRGHDPVLIKLLELISLTQHLGVERVVVAILAVLVNLGLRLLVLHHVVRCAGSEHSLSFQLHSLVGFGSPEWVQISSSHVLVVVVLESTDACAKVPSLLQRLFVLLHNILRLQILRPNLDSSLSFSQFRLNLLGYMLISEYVSRIRLNMLCGQGSGPKPPH